MAVVAMLCVVTFAVLPRPSSAADLTNMSDTMSRLEVSIVDVTHSFVFTPATAINLDDGVQITIPSAFGDASLDIADYSITQAAGGTACAAWTEVVYVPANDVIQFECDTAGAAGTGAITVAITTDLDNPAATGEQEFLIQTYDLGPDTNFGGGDDVLEDNGDISVSIIDDDTVNITGYIDTVLTFDIDTSTYIVEDMDVNIIAWQSGTTVRYTMNGTPDLSGVSVGQNLEVDSATNSQNNGLFTITAVVDASDYIEVTNTLVTDASYDEASDSPAVADAYNAHCDASGGADPCDSHLASSDDAGYVVDLGELTLTAVNDSEDVVMHADGANGAINYIWFDFTTNADGGIAVTVIGANTNDIDGTPDSDMSSLDGPTGSEIRSVDTTGGGTVEVVIGAGSGLYGLQESESHTPWSRNGATITVDDNYDGDTGHGMIPSPQGTGATGPETIFSTSAAVDDGRASYEVAVSPDASDGTGTYTDSLTFIATSTF